MIALPDTAAALLVFLLSATATLIVRTVARATGSMAIPRPDRWHQTPAALHGGVAIAFAFIAGMLLFAPLAPPVLSFLLLTAGMFAVGWADDLWELRPQTKLIAQIAAGLLLYSLDFHFNAALPWLLDLAIVVFWVVAITNAMNLLDNMNGLCAGVALIAAGFRWALYLQDGNPVGATQAAIFAGAVGGFLVFNFPRGTIFMGDAGSFVIGFVLAALNLTSGEVYSKGLLSILFFPVAILALPIFDTAFVSVNRWLSGRALSEGGRDHTSHRLVAVGLSETTAVAILYGVSIAGGGIALGLYRVGFSYAWFFAGLFLLGLVLFGIYLASIRVYPETAVPWERLPAARGFTLPREFRYKRVVLWVFLDTLTLLLAWYLAFATRFSGSSGWETELERFQLSAPLIVLAVLLSLFAGGLYRTDWQHFSLHEVRAIVSGSMLGLALAAIVLAVALEPDLAFALFPVAAGATVLMLAGTRLFLRSLADWLRHRSSASERVLIYGAGVGGELALRELRGNRDLGKAPVGFIDDDPVRQGMSIHGVRVLGDVGQLERLVDEHQIAAVVVSTAKITHAHHEQLRQVAERHALKLLRLQIAMVPYEGSAPQVAIQ